MKISIIAIIIATAVCILIEFRKKIAGRQVKRNDLDIPQEEKSSFGKGLVIVVGIVCLAVIAFFVFQKNSMKSSDSVKGPADSPRVFSDEPSIEEMREAEKYSIFEGNEADYEKFPVKDEGITDRVETDLKKDSGITKVGKSEQKDSGSSNENAPSAIGKTMAAAKTDAVAGKAKVKTTTDSTARILKKQAASKPRVEKSASMEQGASASPVNSREKPSQKDETVQIMEEPTGAVAVLDEALGAPFTIHIGSYETREKAFQVASHFKEKGDPAFTSYYEDPFEGKQNQVFIGNYKTIEEVKVKADQLKRRKFRQVKISNRMFTVQVVGCSSYNITEEIIERLKAKGHVPYMIRCENDYGKNRVLVGAFLNDKMAENMALTLMKEKAFSGVTLVLR